MNQRIAILFAFFITLLSACNDLPTEMGFSLLYDTITVTPITSEDRQLILNTTNRKFIQSRFNCGGMLLGEYGDKKSLILLRFADIPDSLSYLESDKIVSAKVAFHPLRYAMGDTGVTNILSFNVYKVQKLFTVKASYDSIMKDPADYIDYSKLRGTYSDPIEYADTIPAKYFDIDRDLIVEWLNMEVDSVLKYQNWGIALLPNPSSTVVRQISAQLVGDTGRTHPFIEVIYYNSANELDTFTMQSAIDLSVATDAAPDPGDFVVQGATEWTSQLYFDVSFFEYNTAIHKAELELTVDKSRSYNGNDGMDSLITLYYLNDTTYFSDNDNLDTLRTYYGARTNGSDKFFVSSISSGVEYWIRNKKPGFLHITTEGGENEYRQMDRIYFYGPNNPDPNKRPKLRIIYSTRPVLKKDKP